MPENFENLSVDSDLPPGNVMQIPTGFALSNPVPPGEHQILYSYSMPRNTGSIKYNIRLPFGSENFKMLVPEKSKIETEYNLLKDSTLVDDKAYEILQGQNIEKGEYDHFMLKEIYEQQFTIKDTMRGRIDPIDGTAHLGGIEDHINRIKDANRIYITACGTSWHAGLIGKYLIEEYAGIPVHVEYASEFRYRKPIICLLYTSDAADE